MLEMITKQEPLKLLLTDSVHFNDQNGYFVQPVAMAFTKKPL